MQQIELNTINSFKLVKSDIIKIQNDIIGLVETQKALLQIIEKLKSQLYPKRAVQAVKSNTIYKRARKLYVASRSANKFHIAACPFAQNIKPRTKKTFLSKNSALNEGYKPCECVK